MERETLVSELAELGLTRNQSLAYLTLLEDDGDVGLTGYEVGARSGVPRSAVYKVLRQLEDTGAAFCVGSDPQRFHAAEPEGWLDRVRRATVTRLARVGQSLASLPTRTRPEPVWIVRRYDDVLERVAHMIRGAEQAIYLSLWRREIDRLAPVLAEVAGRDLHRVLHCPQGLSSPPPEFSCWLDATADDPTKAHWAHKALVVIDRREALIGRTDPAADNDAVWTTNSSLVDAATNHIILDVTLLASRTGRSCEVDVAPMMRPTLVRAG